MITVSVSDIEQMVGGRVVVVVVYNKINSAAVQNLLSGKLLLALVCSSRHSISKYDIMVAKQVLYQ